MSSSTGNLQRSKTIRQISRPSQTPQHIGPFHRGDAESFRLCDEGGELLAAKREIIRLEGILEAKQREEELQGEHDRKRVRRAPSGRCDGEQQGLHAAPRKANASLRGLARRARRRLKFAKAQAQKGICRACARLLQRMEQRDCFMADDESSTEEEAPAEATLDQGPPGSGKTKMMKKLRKLYSLTIYNWPKDERWWDLYGDGQYDIIMLDEFRSQKMITDLNPILSGDPVTLSRRGWPQSRNETSSL